MFVYVGKIEEERGKGTDRSIIVDSRLNEEFLIRTSGT